MFVYFILLSDKIIGAISKSGFHFFQIILSKKALFLCLKIVKVIDTLERYYKNEGNLVLLSINESKFTSAIKSEKSTNNEIYPYL
ncbi:DUF952 domain-containing protein [Lacihabitans sp. CS3-21]|nr:DUF952 domain-containing protein [Lacihabitans sp. CS3-21]